MPIYEYECSKCGRFEVIQKASDKVLKANPDCDRKDCPKNAVRVISESAFHLKGGGWYKTDYAKSGGGSEGAKKKSLGDSSKSEPSASESKSDSQPGEKKSLKVKGGGGGGCGSGCGCH